MSLRTVRDKPSPASPTPVLPGEASRPGLFPKRPVFCVCLEKPSTPVSLGEYKKENRAKPSDMDSFDSSRSTTSAAYCSSGARLHASEAHNEKRQQAKARRALLLGVDSKRNSQNKTKHYSDFSVRPPRSRRLLSLGQNGSSASEERVDLVALGWLACFVVGSFVSAFASGIPFELFIVLIYGLFLIAETRSHG